MSWWIVAGIASHVVVYGFVWWAVKKMGIRP